MVWVSLAAPAVASSCSIPAGDGTRQRRRQETFSKCGLKSLGSVGLVTAGAQAELAWCWPQGMCSSWGNGINYVPALSLMLWEVGTVGHPDSQHCLRDVFRICKPGMIKTRVVPVFCSHFFFNQESATWRLLG